MIDVAYHTSRHTSHHHIVGYISRLDGTGSNHYIIADDYTWINGRIGSNPTIVADGSGCRLFVSRHTECGIEGTESRDDHHVRGQKAVVSNDYTTAIQDGLRKSIFQPVSCSHSQHEKVTQSQRPRDLLLLLLLEVSSQAPSVFLHPLEVSGSAQNKLARPEVFLAQVLDLPWFGEVRHPASFAFRSSRLCLLRATTPFLFSRSVLYSILNQPLK